MHSVCGMICVGRNGWQRHGIAALVAVSALLASLHAAPADATRRGFTTTALDRYVAQPDAAYRWRKAAESRDGTTTIHAIEMVSQQWLTPGEVDRTEWRHWMLIMEPDGLAHATPLLYVTGGSNRSTEPPRPRRDLLEIARTTRSIVVSLHMVPNQPLVFDGDGHARTEDDLIAYSWDKFLRSGDERWPARLPMTKAVVRAMDTVTAFFASRDRGPAVDRFVVAGESKRGWTTWTTAAVDKRVVAICPMVIDVLNPEAVITHHYRAYGFYTPALNDYVNHRIVDWLGTPESRALYAIEDPFAYRDRLVVPKLILNACGDQFFVPDSSQFYFRALPGVSYLRYVPNTDHFLRNSDAMHTLLAWHDAIARGVRLPEFTWTHGSDGSINVKAATKPAAVMLWQASNPNARDFRQETIGATWTAAPLAGDGGSFNAKIATPTQGYTAYFVELTFDLGAGAPLKLTTDVRVLPDTLPFPPPASAPPAGFLRP